MLQDDHAHTAAATDAPPPRSDVPPPAPSNALPEAHDKTTEQIHSLSNFSVSEAVGLPLLSKDIGKTSPTGRPDSRAAASGPRQGYFGYYSSEDRIMAAFAIVMILGPLLLGAFRG